MDKKVYYRLAVAGWVLATIMGAIILESIVDPIDAPASTIALSTLFATAVGAFGATTGVVLMRLYREKLEEDRRTNKDPMAPPQHPNVRRF